MFTLDGVRKFHTWTHLSLSLVLDHLSTIPARDYARQLPDFGLATLQAQVIHILNCEGFWIHTLQSSRYVDRDLAQHPSVDDARLLEGEISGQTLVYLSNLTSEQLNADTELRFPDGDIAIRTPALVIHHVLTHAFHHKGQIVAMCRALGHPARDTDLNHFK